MRVVIDAALFARSHSDEDHGALLSLFRIGLGGYHPVEVKPESSMAFRRWLDGRDEKTRSMCRQALDLGVKKRAQRRRITIHVEDVPSASWKERRLPLGDALKLLNRPLTLLLENGRHEPAFLRVLTRLRTDFKFDQLVKEGVIDCRTYGGIDENRKWIEERADQPELLLRFWVMCDSDARRFWTRPEDTSVPAGLGRGARKLAERCANLGIRLHILCRRFVESYLPLPAIQQWAIQNQAKKEVKHAALAALNLEQRYHYNMKEGFARDRKDPEHETKVGDLYEGLDPEVAEALELGLGGDIVELFHEKDFRIFESWLKKDQQEAEAHKIVDSIMEMI